MKPAEIPLVRLIVPFIAGVLVALYFQVSIGFCVVLFLMFFTLSLTLILFPSFYRLGQHYLAGTLMVLLFFSGGMFRMITADYAREKQFAMMGAEVCRITVTGYPEARANTYRFPAKVDRYLRDGWHHPARCHIMVYVYKDDPRVTLLYPGQQCWVRGEIRPFPYRHNPGEFNYQRFMADHRVYGQVMADTASWGLTGARRVTSLTGLAAVMQHSLVQKLSNAGFSDRELGVAAALMAGERTLLDPETEQHFSRSGAMHVLAISGLHIGIIYYVLFSLLAFLRSGRYGRLLRFILVVGIIWAYVFVTGLSSSAVRAATMFSFFSLGDLLSRKAHPLNILAASALLMLSINPYLIRSAGFLLSYLAVTGIILFYHPLRRILLTGYYLPDQIISLFAVSLAAQLGTAPLSVFYFHQFPVWFVLTNLLVIPLVTLIVYGFIFWLITLPVAVISGAVAWVLKAIISLLLRLVTLFSHLPLQVIGHLHPEPLQVVLWYVLIFSVSLILVFRKKAGIYLSQVTLSLLVLIWIIGYAFPQKECIFYDIPHCSVIGLKNNRQTVILDCSSPPGQPQQLSYYTGISAPATFLSPEEIHQRAFPGPGNVLQKQSSLFYWNKGFFSVDTLTGYYFESTHPEGLPPDKTEAELDLLYFTGNRWWNLYPLLDRITFRRVIMDAGVPAYVAIQVRLICLDYGISCYNIREQGPLVLKL